MESNNAAMKNKAFCLHILQEIKSKPAKKIWNKYFLYNVEAHAKNQSLSGTNEKTTKMSVRTFLPRALQLLLLLLLLQSHPTAGDEIVNIWAFLLVQRQ